MKYLFLCCVFMMQLSFASERCAPDSVCSIGIFPHAGTRYIRDTYGTLAEDISFELDVTSRLFTTKTLGEFKKSLYEQTYDIVLLGPGTYGQVYDEINYEPIARPIKKVQFAIFVLDDSGINSLADLSGKRFGKLDSQTATALTTRKILKEAGVYSKLSDHVEFGSSHDCAYALVSERVDGCSTPVPLLAILQKQIPKKFKILKLSEPLPSSVYLVHKGLSKDNKELFKEYLLQKPNLTTATKEDYLIMRLLQRESP